MPKDKRHVRYILFPGVCSDSWFVHVLISSLVSIISMQVASVLEEVVKDLWEKVLMPQMSKSQCM